MTTDPTEQQRLLADIDARLASGGFGLPLYQVPDIAAFDSTKVSGVTAAQDDVGFLWNFWGWTVVS